MPRWPTYLLKAPDDRMGRWKADAATRGMTFAEYTRQALDAYSSSSPAPAPDLPEYLADPRTRRRPTSGGR